MNRRYSHDHHRVDHRVDDSAFEPEISADESQLAATAFLARYSGRTLDASRHDLRGFFQSAAEIGLSCWTRLDRRSSCSAAHGRAWPGALDDRTAAVDRVRLLSIRSYRWADHIEPGPDRPAHQGPTERGPWNGPRRVGHVLVHRGTLQPVAASWGATHNARSRLTDGAVASARVGARGRWRAPPASSDTPCLRAAIARL